MYNCSWITIISITISGCIFVSAPRIIQARRSRKYQQFENKSDHELALKFPIHPLSLSGEAKIQRSMADLLTDPHNEAITAQNKYHANISRSAASLLIAGCATALTACPLESLRSIEWLAGITSERCIHNFHVTLSIIDFLALFALLVLYYGATVANRDWLTRRSKVELLRQYEFLKLMFPATMLKSASPDVTSQFFAESNAIEAALTGKGPDELSASIRSIWTERSTNLSTSTMTLDDIKPDSLHLYLVKRLRRQLGWFLDSLERLRALDERRLTRVKRLYWVVLCLAFTKFGVTLFHTEASSGRVSLGDAILVFQVLVLPALLILTAWSAVETAHFLSQNSRSLFHRYQSQVNRISHFIDELQYSVDFTTLGSSSVDFDKPKIKGIIIEFEHLMIEELIDWVHISSHDRMDISA